MKIATSKFNNQALDLTHYPPNIISKKNLIHKNSSTYKAVVVMLFHRKVIHVLQLQQEITVEVNSVVNH